MDYPESLEHIDAVVNDMGRPGKFTIREIPTSVLPDLHTILSSRPEDPSAISTSCTPVYRDVLVLEKASEIIGLVKICFDCSQQQMLGSTTDTRWFGHHGEFRALEQLLYPERN